MFHHFGLRRRFLTIYFVFKNKVSKMSLSINLQAVDMMRHLRATEARRHVREEVPFFTGRLIELDELAEVLS